MFWDNYTPTVCIQAIDTSDYMKERSWNVTPEEISKLLVRNNPDGTMTVSLGTNNEITLSKEHGKCQIRIEDTGSEVNVHVEVSDIRYENGVKNETVFSQSCRLKDFRYVFEPVSPPEFDWMDGLNLLVGSASTTTTIWGKSYKYNEMWHKTKTRGISTSFNKDRWNNPGAKNWRNVQTKPLKVIRNVGKGVGVGAGGVLVLVDVAISGEIQPSDWINGSMAAISWTGVGSVVALVWFVADFGTMGVNKFILGNGAVELGDMLDKSNFGKAITIEMY
jgi:hypothetical protein